MNNNEDKINRINQIVRSGENASELPTLVLSLDEDTKTCVMSFSKYLIQEGDASLLSMMLSNEKVLTAADTLQLWEDACHYDEANILDICFLAFAKQFNLSPLKNLQAIEIAIEKESSYAIKTLSDIDTNKDAIHTAIVGRFPITSMQVLKVMPEYPRFYTENTEQWLSTLKKNSRDVWGKSEYAAISDWMTHQATSTVYRVIDIAIIKSNLDLLHIASNEIIRKVGKDHLSQYVKSKVPEDYVLNCISDNNLAMFMALNGSNLIGNNKKLHEALSDLIQRPDSLSFMRHLLLNAMPEVKDFVCKLLKMPYDRLALHKTERPLVMEEKSSEAYRKSLLLSYVCIMVDKFGVEDFAKHARYEWHIEYLISIGHTPFELIRYIQCDELKTYALTMASS